MALARVQATPQASTTNSASVAVTMSTPPTIGNGLVVAVTQLGSQTGNTSCTDTAGNAYTRAVTQGSPNGATCVDLWTCKVTAGAGPFTITVTGVINISRTVVAIEVSSVGGGLVVDQQAGAEVVGASWTAGPTAALTSADVFLVAAICFPSVGSTFLTVGAATPSWTQELEGVGSAPTRGEVDTRVLTTGLGAPQSASWTADAGATYAAVVIAAFKASAGGGGGPALSGVRALRGRRFVV